MEILPESLCFADGEAHLKSLAMAMVGLEDFGGKEYEEGLGVFLASLDEDCDFTPEGRTNAAGLVLTALAGRLVSEASLRAHPEHADVAIEAPIVILGLPRTGTTALHKLLCCDPANQGLELWLGQNPLPRPPRSEWDAHPAYQRSRATVEAMNARSPDMAGIHAMHADQADECWNLLRQSFTTVTFECVASVASYSRWWAECDMREAYRRYAANLRTIGLHDTGRRWVLKDPSHLFAPDALLDTFPDALFVMTHRDPARSIPSVCSLNESARQGTERHSDLARLGREQLELWARGVERVERLRERAPGQVLDVHFREFLGDPLGVAWRIARAAGHEPSPEARASMGRWLEANRPGAHVYGPERYGLTNAAMRERFAEYIERHAVELEGGEGR